jgi:hypothetical protein
MAVYFSTSKKQNQLLRACLNLKFQVTVDVEVETNPNWICDTFLPLAPLKNNGGQATEDNHNLVLV